MGVDEPQGFCGSDVGLGTQEVGGGVPCAAAEGSGSGYQAAGSPGRCALSA